MTFKVLLVDDEPGALEGMQLWIDWAELGFEISGTCSNGLEGLRMLEELEPDLVITDVNMPLMDGLEMIATWQRVGTKPVSFVIISGYSEFEYAQKAMRYGITHYLLKPIETEEASRVLRLIYQELQHDRERRKISEVASREEVVSLLQKLIAGQSVSDTDRQILEHLSDNREVWSFCLVYSDPAEYTKLREQAASLLADKDAMYLVDMDMYHFGIVFGYTTDQQQENESRQVLAELSDLYSTSRVFMAMGAEEQSLIKLEHCYTTAREAILYRFYDPEYAGVISYEEVRNRPFHNHYDQIHLMDGITRALSLLDPSGFREAVHLAEQSFRERLIAPEIVKKIVIHLLYQMIEHMKVSGIEQAEAMTGKYNVPKLSDEVLTLDELMGCLLSCGQDCLNLLIKEQAGKSQGIVQDINRYIREHYREALTIKKLSEVFYLHPVYLGQLLMKKNGISFNEFVHDLRIKEAAELLQENQYKNSEIAERVGYVNYNQFLKQFEKRMHMSPNEYKNRNLNF